VNLGHAWRKAVVLFVGTVAFAVVVSCSNPVTPGIFYTDHIFRIVATSAYSGELVTDASTTPVSGSSSQDISFTAVAGQKYTLTVTKSANDGTSLEVQLIAEQTVDGNATSVVVQSQTTTDPNVPARVVLTE